MECPPPRGRATPPATSHDDALPALRPVRRSKQAPQLPAPPQHRGQATLARRQEGQPSPLPTTRHPRPPRTCHSSRTAIAPRLPSLLALSIGVSVTCEGRRGTRSAGKLTRGCEGAGIGRGVRERERNARVVVGVGSTAWDGRRGACHRLTERLDRSAVRPCR